MACRRAGRFGTKGLAITFVTSESDAQVMAAIQSRFEVAVPELPDHVEPANYSECLAFLSGDSPADTVHSDLVNCRALLCFPFLPSLSARVHKEFAVETCTLYIVVVLTRSNGSRCSCLSHTCAGVLFSRRNI